STERATIVPPIRHQLLRSALWTTSRASHPNGVERLFCQLDLGHLGAVEVKAQGQPIPVNHQHPFGALTLLCGADFLAAILGRGEGAIKEGHRPIELTPLVERR